jgi:RNA polymerase sigma-70 factor, Bacteroides expansion family 1
VTAEHDRALIGRVIRGDERAFDEIFRTWYAPLVRAAETMVRDRGIAEEVVQEVMLELWRRRESLDPSGTAQAYLLQATRNRALNHLRHLRVQRRVAPQLARDETREATAPSRLVAQEMEAAVLEAMQELPPRCREVFELSRVQGLRYSEIAELLGVSVKAVEAQMGKALRTMRERLAPWLPAGRRL